MLADTYREFGDELVIVSSVEGRVAIGIEGYAPFILSSVHGQLAPGVDDRLGPSRSMLIYIERCSKARPGCELVRVQVVCGVNHGRN